MYVMSEVLLRMGMQVELFRTLKRLDAILTLLHSEQPKLCGVLAVLSAIGLNYRKPSDQGLPFAIPPLLGILLRGETK